MDTNELIVAGAAIALQLITLSAWLVARIQRDGRLEAAARRHGLSPIVRLQ